MQNLTVTSETALVNLVEYQHLYLHYEDIGRYIVRYYNHITEKLIIEFLHEAHPNFRGGAFRSPYVVLLSHPDMLDNRCLYPTKLFLDKLCIRSDFISSLQSILHKHVATNAVDNSSTDRDVMLSAVWFLSLCRSWVVSHNDRGTKISALDMFLKMYAETAAFRILDSMYTVYFYKTGELYRFESIDEFLDIITIEYLRT